MQPIYLRNAPPPIEKFDHINFLAWLASWIRPERYLELGVRDGRCFIEVAQQCKTAIAVDMAPLQYVMPENSVYEQMTTDDYFKKIEGLGMQFDMVFIDADHSFEQSYKDFLNVKDLVIPDGFVIFHDTYPYSEEMIAPHFSGDCYKTVIKIREEFKDEWELVTLPFTPGVTIAKKIYNKVGMPWML